MKSNTIFRKKKIKKELTTHERLLIIGELLGKVAAMLNED